MIFPVKCSDKLVKRLREVNSRYLEVKIGKSPNEDSDKWHFVGREVRFVGGFWSGGLPPPLKLTALPRNDATHNRVSCLLRKLSCIVLYCIVLYVRVSYGIVVSCGVLYWIVLYRIVLYCSVL